MHTNLLGIAGRAAAGAKLQQQKLTYYCSYRARSASGGVAGLCAFHSLRGAIRHLYREFGWNRDSGAVVNLQNNGTAVALLLCFLHL